MTAAPLAVAVLFEPEADSRAVQQPRQENVLPFRRGLRELYNRCRLQGDDTTAHQREMAVARHPRKYDQPVTDPLPSRRLEPVVPTPTAVRCGAHGNRSEERRVGKEC